MLRGKAKGSRKAEEEEVLPAGHHDDMLSLCQAFLFASSAPPCLAFFEIDCIFFSLLPTPQPWHLYSLLILT